MPAGVAFHDAGKCIERHVFSEGRRGFRVSVCLALVSVFFGSPAFGATYYIDGTNGDDSLNGLHSSPQGGDEGPWKTISRVNSANFDPGDSILFKRGETWDERLLVPSHGAPGSPITFGAYGDGPKPVIHAPPSESSAIVSWHSHIIVRDLVLKDGKLGMAVVGGSYGISILDVEVYDSGDNGISIAKGGSDIHIDGAVVSNVGNSGIVLLGSPSNKLSNVVVENCRVSGAATNDGITIHKDGSGNSAGTNFIIRNNYAELCSEQGYDITTGSGIELTGNTSSKNGDGGILVGYSASNVTIKHHHSFEEPISAGAGAILGAPNIILAYSIFRATKEQSLVITGDANGVQIYNNLFLKDDGAQNPFDLSGEIENITVENNIFCGLHTNMTRAIRFLEPTRPPDHPTFVLNHNIYYGLSPVDNRIFYDAATERLLTFSEFQSEYDQELNGFNADPLFVNVGSNDFRLEAGSPAIDAGNALPACGISTCLGGVAIPLDGDNDGSASFDIGPYEYVHPSADTDGDGMSDADEVQAGTSPTDVTSLLAISEITWGRVSRAIEVHWPSVSGRHYRVLRSMDPAGSSCYPIGTNIAATPVENIYTDTNTVASPYHFYTIQLE